MHCGSNTDRMGREREASSRAKHRHKKSKSKADYGYDNCIGTNYVQETPKKEESEETDNTYEEMEQPIEESRKEQRRRERKERKAREAAEEASRLEQRAVANGRKYTEVYMPRSTHYDEEAKETERSAKPYKKDQLEYRQHYIGAMTAKHVSNQIKPNDFALYFRLPDENSPIPHKLRLFLVYKSNQTKEVFHFPVVCTYNQKGDPSWSLRYADSATFPSLADLIKYHKIYSYMDPNTGKVETFPVWKDVLIDSSNLD